MRRGAALVVALALTAAGCGGSGDDEPADVVREWVDDLADGRAEQACTALTDRGRVEAVALVQLFGGGPAAKDCERQVKHLSTGSRPDAPPVEVTSESVDGDRAIVETDGGPKRVQLRRESGGWRVHSFILDGWPAFGIPDYPPDMGPPGVPPPD